MEFDWMWKAVLIVIAGTFLLRMAGRKSISQMTLPQTVIMIGIGSLLIQPVAGSNVWVTIAVGVIFIATLFIMEYVQVKGNIFEKIITGKSKVLIENGTLNEKNMKKLRMTVDQLEMNLRMQNIKKLDDVEWATLEPNGQVGFSLKNDAQPVTKKEFNQLASDVQEILNQVNTNSQINQLRTKLNDLNKQIAEMQTQRNMFKELDEKDPDGTSPKHLQ
ncbi:DUF421 domain-containing protein [Lentibacillus amyloliquefaciens]|uniref:YetF C-terminal domain-containing protein n=1 Tax=Lentibacillus amyloliquefaciens TaxID=1472767 RepID=A0A0U4E9V6_9BACI|nr:DUF421 domain-containing protein [Lentibacillus amyloliquefaciens]ALX49681.1 hypothetical protein AOX59_14550 [Lentibacillus amyloliquefaciens]